MHNVVGRLRISFERGEKAKGHRGSVAPLATYLIILKLGYTIFSQVTLEVLVKVKGN